MQRDDAIFYIYFQEYILLVMMAADAFVKNDHGLACFHANSIYRHTMALLDEFNPCHLQ